LIVINLLYRLWRTFTSDAVVRLMGGISFSGDKDQVQDSPDEIRQVERFICAFVIAHGRSAEEFSGK